MKSKIFIVIFFAQVVLINAACKKLVEVPHPTNSITTIETFESVTTANAAIAAIYNDMSFGKNGIRYASGLITIDAGMASDELTSYSDPGNAFLINNLLPNSGDIASGFWSAAYYDIYMANAVIEGVNSSKLPNATKNRFIGEAKFLRAFIYFYLVNLFGDVPLVISTPYMNNALLPRTSVVEVYEQITADLLEAQTLLPDDYSPYGGSRTRLCKWAATALLARVYMYKNEWNNAEAQATSIIDNANLFDLSNQLNDVFLKTSNEAIFQLECINQNNFRFATQEGYTFIPPDSSSAPTYILSDQLINAFEPSDDRRVSWVDSSSNSTTTWYYPFKMKIKISSAGNTNEYNTPLRLAEQYLIRAEARAKLNNLTSAIDDINVIRNRAGLSNLPSTLNQAEVLESVAQENRIEFFAEWGHRWLDLKRTEKADDILPPFKGINWQPTDKLWPIPASELKVNPNLNQNPGY